MIKKYDSVEETIATAKNPINGDTSKAREPLRMRYGMNHTMTKINRGRADAGFTVDPPTHFAKRGRLVIGRSRRRSIHTTPIRLEWICTIVPTPDFRSGNGLITIDT